MPMVGGRLVDTQVAIEYIDPLLLRPYEGNAKIHTDANIRKVAKSITEFGFTQPVLIDGEQNIIAGHRRTLAAIKLEMPTVPCIRRTDLTPEQVAAYRIADNRLGLDSEWDEKALAEELARLGEMEIDLAVTGFRASELEQWLTRLETDAPILPESLASNGDSEVDASDFPPDIEFVGTEGEPVDDIEPDLPVEHGQIWALGDHRVMCGDCSDSGDMDALMDGKLADIVFTDPPYGVAIGSKNAELNSIEDGKGGRITEDIEGDTYTPEQLYDALIGGFKNVRSVCAGHCSVYITAPVSGKLGMMFFAMLKEAGLEIRHVLNWIKNRPTFTFGRLDYEYQHEPILFTWINNHKRIRAGKSQTSCWFYNSPNACDLHPTMKPIALIENALLNSSEEGDILLDPFVGSGSSIIAAHDVGRRCYAMDIDPHYVSVAIRRWEKHTGLKAELITDKDNSLVSPSGGFR